jgi:hypothetical protein
MRSCSYSFSPIVRLFVYWSSRARYYCAATFKALSCLGFPRLPSPNPSPSPPFLGFGAPDTPQSAKAAFIIYGLALLPCEPPRFYRYAARRGFTIPGTGDFIFLQATSTSATSFTSSPHTHDPSFPPSEQSSSAALSPPDTGLPLILALPLASIDPSDYATGQSPTDLRFIVSDMRYAAGGRGGALG